MDVLCLADEVPPLTQFFAAEDEFLLNIAVLCFERGHPLMRQCFEEATRMGHNVQWAGPGPICLRGW
jgi:hypothetical protein